MQDRPTSQELIEAVIHFLEEEVQPLVNHDPRMRFRTLIATNVLRIVTREREESEPLLRAEWQRLQLLTGQDSTEIPTHPDQLMQEVLGMNQLLCDRIRSGEADSEGSWQLSLFAHLQATVKEKLIIANPRFLERATS
jgi:hypothetical protein